MSASDLELPSDLIDDMEEWEEEEEPSCSIVPVENKGLGVVALLDFALGDLILEEDPLCVFPSEIMVYAKNGDTDDIKNKTIQEVERLVGNLTPEESKAFWDFNDKFSSQPKAVKSVVGIVKTNALPLGATETEYDANDTTQAGMFFTICRVNHSCVPNASYNWNATLHKETLYAIADIKQGEEITVSYFMHNPPYEERTKQMRDSFGFVCSCPECKICSEDSVEKEKRDNLRRRIKVLDHHLTLTETPPPVRMAQARELLKLYVEAGITAPYYRSRTLYDMFNLTSKQEFAFLEEAYELEVYDSGPASDNSVKYWQQFPRSIRMGDEYKGRCYVCGFDLTKICSNCRTVWYCSREHQILHWPEHKLECGSECRTQTQAVKIASTAATVTAPATAAAAISVPATCKPAHQWPN